jgi:hypothetical protein
LINNSHFPVITNSQWTMHLLSLLVILCGNHKVHHPELTLLANLRKSLLDLLG